MMRPSRATEKALFALSGNRCAHPDCTQHLTHRPGPCKPRTVVGEVCHIHGKKRESPRWNPELTAEQIHDSRNLILLCPTHHTIVDDHPETYTAAVLRGWKEDHERKFAAARVEALTDESRPDSLQRFPTSLVDREIENELRLVRSGRPLQDFDTSGRCLRFGTALTSGEYSGGTSMVRARALAWCARLLARTNEVKTAEEYLNQARNLGAEEEVAIATALIRSREGHHALAFRTLADINSRMARSASLIVAADQGGPQNAIEWARTAGIEAADLDSDGKMFFLGWLLENRDWDAAWGLLGAITDHDHEFSPALNHLTAIAELLRTVPDEFRDHVRQQVPLFTADLPLASGGRALRSRRTARRHFRAAADAAHELDCSTAAAVSEEYVFWLDLLDPEHRQAAQGELGRRLRDPGTHLRLVPLALQFEVEVDLAEADRAIRREITKRGSTTPATAAARLALAVTRGAPGAVADYIAQHRADFAGHLDETALGVLEADALVQARRLDQARVRLDQLVQGGLSRIDADRLRARLARAEGENTTTSAKRRFEKTNSLSDLNSVVTDLAAAGSSAELRRYAATLFERTHSLKHAEVLGTALAVPEESRGLTEFLAANQDLVEQSGILKLCRCWSLFWSGSLLQARAELEALSDCQEHPNYRALQVELGIGLGDWESLGAFVEAQYHARDQRDLPELVGATQLAIALHSRHGRALAEAAAAKARDDAEALAALYHLATRAGWEGEPVVASWLHRAAELSGPHGPVRPMTLKKLVEDAPKRREERAGVLEKLVRSEIPTFVAAEFSNTSLADIMLLPALANAFETDPRRRRAVPAYSGQRPQVPCEPGCRAGFDATALLTLGLLGLLDESLDAFDTVHLPHSTLRWLFQEEQEVSFHQPSRLVEAGQIRDLLDRGRIASLEPTAEMDKRLAAQVGDDLANLIAAAESADPAGKQSLVVRPFPVHRIGSLMDEDVDLATHYAVLSSCRAIVDALRDNGLLTDQEFLIATSYLKLNEEPWPHQPVVSGSASLYLDDLALTYFAHLRLLERLHESGFTIFVTQRAASEALDLLAYKRLAAEVREILGRIRQAVKSRIAHGRVQVDPVQSSAPSDGPDLTHPTLDLFALTDRCDVVVTDDRFINGYPYADGEAQAVPTVSTLDILDMLASSDAISAADRLTHRTSLRRFGYLFVPVDEDELLGHLESSAMRDGQVIEPAHLRAVRENVLVVRMSEYLQLPVESQWLSDTMGAFVGALRALWLGDPDISQARARSDWILAQIDLRGWTHRLPPEAAARTMEGDRAEQLVRLLLPHADVSSTVRKHYWDWVESRLLKPIQATEPALYEWLAERFLLTVSRVADDAAETMDVGG